MPGPESQDNKQKRKRQNFRNDYSPLAKVSITMEELFKDRKNRPANVSDNKKVKVTPVITSLTASTTTPPIKGGKKDFSKLVEYKDLVAKALFPREYVSNNNNASPSQSITTVSLFQANSSTMDYLNFLPNELHDYKGIFEEEAVEPLEDQNVFSDGFKIR